MIKVALHILIFHFKIRKCRVATGTPVDDIVAFVNQPLFIERDKHLANRLGQTLIHGEAVPLPVQRTAQFFQLFRDGSARFVTPFPHPLHKRVTAQRLAVSSFRMQLTLDHILGSNSGMVCARLPQGVEPLHTFPASQNILQGIVEGMTNMQTPCNIGRRYDNRKGRFIKRLIGMKIVFFLPEFSPAFFNFFRFVMFIQLNHSVVLLLIIKYKNNLRFA